MLLQFEKCLTRINTFFKLIGLSIESDDSNKTLVQRLKRHWKFTIHLLPFNYAILSQLIWFILGLIFGASLWEMTYLLPCLTLCLLGGCKIYYFLRHLDHVNDLIKALRTLQAKAEFDEEKEQETKKWLTFLSGMNKLLLILNIFGIVAFAVGPFIIMGSHFYATGEIKFFLPFIQWLPFDQFDIRFWPFVYLIQMWAAWVTVFSVFGPDYFFFTCCTFIQIQFMKLQHGMERIVREDSWKHNATIDEFKAEFVLLVNHHRELIRCINLLEIIFSKSTLFNVLTSSLIICATGFNLMTIEDLALMTPFTSFLFYGLLQIFFYCYYGDYVMRSSMGVGDAVYNSRWYETGAIERKYLLIVLVRSQKPCKLTAYGFTVINLTAFNRILSTSWSYFALLRQMYRQ